MSSVKILLGNISQEWKRILSQIVNEDEDLLVIRETPDPVEVLLKVKDLGPDAVILPQTPQGGEPGICSHLLLEYPNLLVVLIPVESGPNVLYRMILRKEVCEASKEALRTFLGNTSSDKGR